MKMLVNKTNDQLDAIIAILLIIESAQHVSGKSFAHIQERKTVVYSSVVYCPNVVVGWRSGVRQRRLCVRCEGCFSRNQIPMKNTFNCTSEASFKVRVGIL